MYLSNGSFVEELCVRDLLQRSTLAGLKIMKAGSRCYCSLGERFRSAWVMPLFDMMSKRCAGEIFEEIAGKRIRVLGGVGRIHIRHSPMKKWDF